MKWRERFEAMIEELNAHPDIDVYDAELGDGASDEDLTWAAEQYGHAIPAEITDFFRELNGLHITWSHRDPRWQKLGASGSMRLFDVRTTFRKDWEDDDYDNKQWRPFDWPTDEYYAGFDLNEPGAVAWVYDTAGDGRPFGGSFEQYLEALLQTRGFDYWQEMYGYDAERAAQLGATIQESEGRMQALLPRLFDTVDLGLVGRASELAPANVAMLDEGPAVLAYRLDDLPEELTEALPADADPRNCLFWVAHGRDATGQVFDDIPEPSIGYVNEGMEVAKAMTLAASQTYRLAELLRPEDVPPGGRVYGGRLSAGFHTSNASEIEEWFRNQGVRLLPLRSILPNLYFLKVVGPDDQPIRHLQKSSLVVNAGLRSDLDEVMPGIFAIEAGTSEHDHFQLFAGEHVVELKSDALEPGGVTRVQLN